MITRSITWFGKHDDELSGEHDLPSIDLCSLQKEFGQDAFDPMVESYQIRSENVEFLKRFVEMDFDFSKYDYFLESHG